MTLTGDLIKMDGSEQLMTYLWWRIEADPVSEQAVLDSSDKEPELD